MGAHGLGDTHTEQLQGQGDAWVPMDWATHTEQLQGQGDAWVPRCTKRPHDVQVGFW